MKAPTRVGLLGGSFDPVHNTHLQLARAARDQLNLDAVWLLPAAQPWQRAPLAASPQQRVDMLELAIGDTPGLRVETCEIDRGGPSYTIDTVRALRQHHPDTAFCFILGADQLNNFTSWREWAAIVANVDLAVVQRPGSGGRCDPAVLEALDAAGHRLLQLQLPASTLSASGLRQTLAAGGRVDGLVAPAVARYIDHHHLYRDNSTHGHSQAAAPDR